LEAVPGREKERRRKLEELEKRAPSPLNFTQISESTNLLGPLCICSCVVFNLRALMLKLVYTYLHSQAFVTSSLSQRGEAWEIWSCAVMSGRHMRGSTQP